MPTSLFVSKVIEHLSAIDYKKPSESEALTIHQTMKEFIFSGNSANIKILGDKAFEISMSTDTFSRVLAADYYFSKQKIDNQKKCIESFTDQSLPLSWLVVTLYYGCFYAAVEVLRLTGSYCSYFTKDDCEEIKNLSSNSLNLSSGNYFGSATNDGGYIKVTFRQTNLGSHELVWDRVKSLVSSFDISSVNIKKVGKLDFLNSVFKNKIDIDYPNVVRNRWNYSKSDAYSSEVNVKYGKFRTCISDLSHALNLDVSYKKNESEMNNILFIWALFIFLESTLSNVSHRVVQAK